MGKLDLIKEGLCPNECGKLTVLKHPLKIMLLIPEDLIDSVPEEADEDYYGAIAAMCLECGFTLTIGGSEEIEEEAEG
jgi:hypothetical protein